MEQIIFLQVVKQGEKEIIPNTLEMHQKKKLAGALLAQALSSLTWNVEMLTYEEADEAKLQSIV